jgi:DNA invertase Pin-like site-specific DNA recombinase
MIADAEAGAFEALLVYDTSRFARNVADAWLYRDRLARAGVALVFCADGLIAGNVETYEIEGLKTVADAAYIRRLSRNVGRGYEQKWRLFSDPGGHAPLGFARVGERRLLEPLEGPDLDRARQAFTLYATGAWSDASLADELGLTEAGLAEILTNPLYAGRAVRHKGKPDEEERPARFSAPIEPSLFDRVQTIRERRRTSHSAGGGGYARRAYPLVRLMRCADCESGYHGDATNGRRRIRHSRRPACGSSATYTAESYEAQVARLFDGLRVDESDIRQVLGAIRGAIPALVAPDPESMEAARTDLQRRLSTGSISLETFGREWRRLGRPNLAPAPMPDELRLRKARTLLADFSTLWRNAAVPERLREEALHEIFTRFDVRGPDLIAAHPQPNENAWLFGFAATRQRRDVGMVGARGLEAEVTSGATELRRSA